MALNLDILNRSQREAVEYTEGPLLVLAGAGSGKTRVLTYRIAHMIESCGISARSILAITFTNKAAREMKDRVEQLVGDLVRSMWISTFHSLCVRILRSHAEVLGFKSGFTIYDDTDTKKLLAQIMEEKGISQEDLNLNTVRSLISTAKNELVVPQDYLEEYPSYQAHFIEEIYSEYQQRLKRANAFDFDDLLLYAYILLKQHPEVLVLYQNRFRYILVDEYQDTNRAQYEICRLLASGSGNIMVVGDDDQSIYSWRGADIRNILEFERDYPATKTIKLEQNYRSSETILKAANALIAHNVQRKEKTLFSQLGEGEKLAVYCAQDEREEARWIASEIERLHGLGVSYRQVALFYRTNAQSRMLEDMLMRAGIPVDIVGGVRFYDRAEIRDIMAYLTLAINPFDDMAARRIINVPRRGIGKTSIDKINAFAQEMQISFLEACAYAVADEEYRPALRTALAQFLSLIGQISSYEGSLKDVIEMIIRTSGLEQSLLDQNTPEAQDRIENLHEFVTAAHEFSLSEESLMLEDVEGNATSETSLARFVEWVSLRSDLDALDGRDAAVTMMTVHASKGLEFDYVFVAGMEKGLFPHEFKGESNNLEEERRLAYVAITRARVKLFLTHALKRTIFGKSKISQPSCFLQEIPQEYTKKLGLGSEAYEGVGFEKRGSRRGIAGSGARAERESLRFASQSRSGKDALSHKRPQTPSASPLDLSLGDKVNHKVFGNGEVVGLEGSKIIVRFEKTGKIKSLLKGFSPLVKL